MMFDWLPPYGCESVTVHRQKISYVFLEDTLAKCGDKKVGLIRIDSGFFQHNILQYLEEKELNYVVAARFNQPIQRFIGDQKGSIQLDDGIEICEQKYTAKTWREPRRMVIVRQKIKERPKLQDELLACLPMTKFIAITDNQLTLQIRNCQVSKCVYNTVTEVVQKIVQKNLRQLPKTSFTFRPIS